MKRFFCTICRKVKRAQKWPAVIQNHQSELVEQRVGACNRHFASTRNPHVYMKRAK